MSKKKRSFLEKITGIKRLEDEVENTTIDYQEYPRSRDFNYNFAAEEDDRYEFPSSFPRGRNDQEQADFSDFNPSQNSFQQPSQIRTNDYFSNQIAAPNFSQNSQNFPLYPDHQSQIQVPYQQAGHNPGNQHANQHQANHQAPYYAPVAPIQSPAYSHVSTNTIKQNHNENTDIETEGQLTIDVYQTEEYIVIKSTIAGVKAEDLDVNINSDMVTIRGERKQDEEVDIENYYYQECYWGPFSRSVILPVEIIPDKAEASMKNGILTIRLLKADTTRTRRIQVKGT